jgi:serine/threonine protein kinase
MSSSTQAPLPVPRACRIAKQVAAALDAAHRLGMIHRDIKPGNILLTRLPAGAESEELAKVLDFGIAKMKEAHLAGGAATLTRTGTSIGTPAYMSPEQAMGKTGEGLDGRADLYSLGVVMYEMLTGELPIQAESEVQMLIGQISTAPEPIRALRPELSEGIGAVVMRCLEKDPARRPASGAALIAQIENWERGGAAGTAPDEPPTVATHAASADGSGESSPARRSSRPVERRCCGPRGDRNCDRRRRLVSRTSRPKHIARSASSRPASGGLAAGAASTRHTGASSGSRRPQQVTTTPPASAKPPVPQRGADKDGNPADDIQIALDGVPMDAATKAK